MKAPLKTPLIIFAIFLTCTLIHNAEAQQLEAMRAASDFRLSDINGDEVILSSYKNKSPVLLFFWTTWCPYCVKELRQLNTMHPELSKDGIEIFSINEDEYVDKVPKFVKNYSLTYRVLLDTERKASDAYGIVGVPTYILVNKEGRIVFNNHYFPHKEYKGLISK